jgi:subtilisin-like proprotein convertase family protein
MSKLARTIPVAAIAATVLIAMPSGAGAATFSNTTAITIPSGAPGTTSGPASPYPSTIGVTGLPGNVVDVNVTLIGLSHTCMSDLRFLLVGPGGQKTILLSTVGPYTGCEPDIVGGTIGIDDEAATTYPCNAVPSGTFKPTAEPASGVECSGPPVVFPAPAPPEPYPVALSAFDGAPAAGTWSLFVFDQFGEDVGSLLAWSLDLTTPATTPAQPAACKGKAATIVGTNGNDSLVGTPGADVIAGLGGNDTISGLAGNDVICGGAGKDTLKGGPGNDFLSGQKGNDKLFGQKGKDKLSGKKGKDLCVGGPGKETAKGCEVEKSI